MGRTDGHSKIEIDVRLGQAARRCAITHELVHVERGHTCAQPPHVEYQVRIEAARRLLPITLLTDALRFSTRPEDIAFDCWVTVEVLRDRLGALSSTERLALTAHTAHHRDWA